jgi:hypothetical protein
MNRHPTPNVANQFKKGNPGKRPGTLNKMTLSARQIIEDAFHGIGGTERLIKWINKSPKNESAWWNNIWVRTLPQSATIRADVQHELAPKSVEELREALEKHGLPSAVFGYDAPRIELPGTLAGGPALDVVPVGDENETKT